ncbi:MAG: FAD-dependent oxidoreductase [Patescibacteria group bacterium]|nr:FAD-dependent oxidoreductase [Patescibacteria group bacterium]
MKIAVIGGGIFGVTVAVRLAKSHSVDLFEKNSDILMAASDVNQCRVHRGYHYPRSDSTVKEVLDANESFTEEFSKAIINNVDNYYCISKHDSLVSAEQYIAFCKRNGLEYEIKELDVIDRNSVDLCVKVKECLFDHSKLKKICWQKLLDSSVNIFLNRTATEEIFDNYDFVVICTYADNGKFLKKFPQFQREYQFEVCEKVFVKLPPSFDNKSVLIMDGPFMGIDPIGDTGMFIIGDVAHTVLQRNLGKYPEIDSKYIPLLDKGIIANPPISNFNLFIESGVRFMPEMKKAKYIGSSFCIKTTLAHVDKTDERPTLINRISDKIVTVFSGKIPTCVEAAKELEEITQEIERKNHRRVVET